MEPRKRPRLMTTQLHLRLTDEELAQVNARYDRYVQLHPRATRSEFIRRLLIGAADERPKKSAK